MRRLFDVEPRISAFFAFLAMTILVACGPVNPPVAATDQVSGMLAQVLQRGTIVVATEVDYPPQSELRTGVARAADTRCAPNEYTANQFVGFDVEVAREVATRLDVEPCFVTPRWTQITAGGWAGRWDVSIGSMVITPERMEALYFAQPYTTGAAVIFVHRDNTSFTVPESLSGKRIGVCAGCAYEAYLDRSLTIPGQEIQYAIRDATVVGYDTDTSALADLALGDGVRLDAVLTDPDTGQSAIRDGLPIRQLGGPLYYDFVAAAVDRSSNIDPVPLVLRMSEIIQEMHRDGTLSKLSQEYYGSDFTVPASEFDLTALGQLP